MRVQLLGDVAVDVDAGGRRRVTAPRPRLILAMLAARLGRPVVEDQLIEAIWGEEAPPSARTALQTYLSALRDELEPERERRAPGSYIDTEPLGYVLRSDGCTVDLDEFETIVAECASATDVASTSVRARLDRALAMWGEPVAEFAEAPWAAGLAARLRERHATALEMRFDLALADGEHASVADRLRSAIELYPFRERLALQLMVALYRMGDQRAALDVGQRLRARLVEDLGLDPGPELSAVEQQILRHDESLLSYIDRRVPSSTPHAESSTMSAPPPMVGRDVELHELIEMIDRHPVVTIVGGGGIGKTLLAHHVGHRRGGAMSSSIVVDLDDLAAHGVDDVLRAVALGFGINEQPGGSLAASMVDTMRERTVLIRVETAELAPDSVVGAIRALAGAPSLRWLVTSQVPLRMAGEQTMRLGGLRPDDAVTVLTASHRGARHHDADTLEEIVAHLDGVPLALELAAGRLDALGAVETLRQLRSGATPTGGDDRPERHRSTAAAAAWSIGLLDADDVQVLASLATHTAPFTLRTARHTWGVGDLDPERIEDVIAQLIERSLVQAIDGSDHPTYRVLDTIRAAVLDVVDEAVVRRNEARLTDVVIDTAQAAMFQVESTLSVDELAGELVVTLDRLHDRADARELVLAGCLALWWAGHSRAAEGSDLLDRALRTHRDVPDMVYGPSAGVAALLSYVRGDMHRTREQLALMGERGDAWMVPAVSHTVDASIAFLDRRYSDAAKHYEETLHHYDAPTGPKLLMIWLGANSLWYAGQLDEALEQYQRLRREASTVDDVYNVAMGVRFEAMLTATLGDVERAWRLAERGLAMATELDDASSLSQAHVAVAVVAHAADDIDVARRHALDAIETTLGPFDLFVQRAAPVILAACCIERGDADTAAVALGWYLDYLDRTGQPPAVVTASLAEAVADDARTMLGRSDFARIAATGARLRLREMHDMARTARPSSR